MKPKYEWFWIRIDGFISLADSLCLIIFGRYWAWSLKFMAWRAIKDLERKIKERMSSE